MKHRITALTLVACASALLASATLAQVKGHGGAEHQHADRAAEQKHKQEATSDRGEAREQARDRANPQDKETLRQKNSASERERQHAEAEDSKIYGYEIMSAEERNEYREKLSKLDSGDARREFVAEHQEAMRKRAKAQAGTPDNRDTE